MIILISRNRCIFIGNRTLCMHTCFNTILIILCGYILNRNIARPVFYVASRGHHADIGGITPGSMPPHSTSIHQEGAVFLTFKLVKKGVFQEQELIAALNAPGKLPGSSGTRNLKDNLSDLKAQVAANRKGIQLVCELIEEYSLEVVQAYMTHIQTSAELAVRELLKKVRGHDCKWSNKLENTTEMSRIASFLSLNFYKAT